MSAAFAVLFGYLSAYHGTFETRVTGDEISHKELFHAAYTFTFKDTTGAKLTGRKGYARLTLYHGNEVLLIAEEPYIGYTFLVSRIYKLRVLIEQR